jgi:hypothetical protein
MELPVLSPSGDCRFDGLPGRKYIEGPTLADRIEVRPLPLEETAAISKQIIEGLQSTR